MIRKRKTSTEKVEELNNDIASVPVKYVRQNDYNKKLNVLIVIAALTLVVSLVTVHHLMTNFEADELGLKGYDQLAIQEQVIATLQSKPRVWILGKRMETGYLRHVVEVFDRIGFERVNGSEQEWDVFWSHDYPFSKQFFDVLKPNQRVNHFPGSGYITNKVSLATSGSQFTPTAYHLPKDKDKFITYAKENPDKLWVKKSNDHRGIHISNLDEIDLESSGTFVQEYIQNPLLIDGRKFDIGLYVTLTSIDPLRVYIYESDLLLRFCTNAYYPFNSSDIDSYVVGDDYMPIWEMPSLKKYFNDLNLNMKQTLNAYLRSIGKDGDVLWKKLEQAVMSVYIEKEELMSRLSRMTYPNTRNFFEMVRFDFLVDEDLNVYLMEANMSPNLSSLHFAPNKLLYEQVIFNLLSLVGLTRIDAARRWSIYEKDYWNMRVSEKDLTVYDEMCASQECYLNCQATKCRLCLACLDEDWRTILKDSYLENLNRYNYKRLIPSNEQITGTNTTNETERNHVLRLWFDGKCQQHRKWCS